MNLYLKRLPDERIHQSIDPKRELRKKNRAIVGKLPAFYYLYSVSLALGLSSVGMLSQLKLLLLLLKLTRTHGKKGRLHLDISESVRVSGHCG